MKGRDQDKYNGDFSKSQSNFTTTATTTTTTTATAIQKRSQWWWLSHHPTESNRMIFKSCGYWWIYKLIYVWDSAENHRPNQHCLWPSWIFYQWKWKGNVHTVHHTLPHMSFYKNSLKARVCDVGSSYDKQ